MTWTWRLPAAIDDPELEAEAASGWASQEEAEDWLREVFADLADQGVAEVTLMNEDSTVYTMSLGQ
ncbi:MAG: hypothetical protein LBV00_05645 [Propionibacteriaceae bacterium]|jgi:hypothetical protein|nr:hypothetical protein [Propionibacteriaceae bacterium]